MTVKVEWIYTHSDEFLSESGSPLKLFSPSYRIREGVLATFASGLLVRDKFSHILFLDLNKATMSVFIIKLHTNTFEQSGHFGNVLSKGEIFDLFKLHRIVLFYQDSCKVCM